MSGQGARQAHAAKKATVPAKKTESAQEQEAAPGSSEGAERYARLNQARMATRTLVEARVSDERDAQWPTYLRETAEHIVQTLSDLALDTDFWASVQTAEQVLGATPQYRATVSEIIGSDLTKLLDLMGYAPPPPSKEIGREMQIAFFEAIEEPDAALRAQLTRETAHRMLIYVYRLRRLLADVDEAEPGTTNANRLGLRLLSMARTGARVIIPATIAAGAVAVLFPPSAAAGAAAAGGAALTAGMSAATKEAFKQGIQVSSAGMMAAALGDQDGKVSLQTVFEATEVSYFKAAQEAHVVARHLLEKQPTETSAWLTASVIEAMRWSFQLERARFPMAETARVEPSHLAAKAVASALCELSDWIQFAPDYDGLQDIHDRLQLALAQLEDYVSGV